MRKPCPGIKSRSSVKRILPLVLAPRLRCQTDVKPIATLRLSLAYLSAAERTIRSVVALRYVCHWSTNVSSAALYSSKMNNSDKAQESDGSTSEIVRIAYRQSRAISNCNGSNDPPKTPNEGFACTNRIMCLPIIASINSSIFKAYTSVKSSNSTVESILNHTVEGLTEGAKIVSPVTSKIGETLEEPLKSIDTVICDGLDYLEERVPSIKLPPGEIYENVEGYIRDVSDSVKKHSNELYVDVKVRLDELTKVVEAQTKKTENPNKDRKSDD